MTKSIRFATALALGTACISGASNFLNKYAVSAIGDPMILTTLKNVVVGIFLAGLILGLGKIREIFRLTGKQLLLLAAVGVIGGALPFGLFFTGLAKTSALNASLIHKTLFLWVLLFGAVILRERLTRWQWLGIGAIFGANLLVGGFKGFRYNAGELMILGATLLWAVENVIAKVALKDISSSLVAASRMAIGGLILVVFTLSTRGISSLYALNGPQWGWIGLTGVMLLGYVLTWYAALKRAPATYVAALLVPATLVTNILSAVFVTHAFSGRDALSSALYLCGILLLVMFARSVAPNSERKAVGLIS